MINTRHALTASKIIIVHFAEIRYPVFPYRQKIVLQFTNSLALVGSSKIVEVVLKSQLALGAIDPLNLRLLRESKSLVQKMVDAFLLQMPPALSLPIVTPIAPKQPAVKTATTPSVVPGAALISLASMQRPQPLAFSPTPAPTAFNTPSANPA